MKNAFPFQFLGQHLILLPEKALLWLDKKILIVSDLHLGKAGHFRKAGIAVPSHIHATDIHKLEILINSYEVEQIIFLGDLFHSTFNKEWQFFTLWLEKFSDLEFHLVKGNHDILPKEVYAISKIKVHEEILTISPFILSHVPLEKPSWPEGMYNIAGHIHPAVRLFGKGYQSVSLPCFYFGIQQAILPAFGIFTGKFLIKPKESSSIFAVANNKIIAI